MAKFRKKAPVSQAIPTASLPDIIFILLFFFMVATKMRKGDPKVVINEPLATQIQSVPETMVTIDLYIGVPKDSKFGTEPVIQAGNKFITAEGVRQYISEERVKLPKSKQNPNSIIVNISMDDEAKVGILSDVEQELRKAGVKIINYKALKNNEI